MNELRGTIRCKKCKKEIMWKTFPSQDITGRKIQPIPTEFGVEFALYSHSEEESYTVTCPYCKSENGIIIE